MKKKHAYLGLDVHKKSITLALIVGNCHTEEFVRKISNNTKYLLKILNELSESYNMQICYEASGCGYKIYRTLDRAGYHCIVVAPSLIPRNGKKVKTDRLDAIKLARYMRSGLLTPVTVPDEQTECDRDLIRMRAFQVRELARIKQAILAFLLRKGIDYQAQSGWTKKFIAFLYGIELSLKDRALLNRYLSHYSYQKQLVDELTQDVEELAKSEIYNDMVSILRGFRGIDYLGAMTILTHIPDFRMFPHPKKLRSYIGLTPGEVSSGDREHRTGITKAGNRLLRTTFIIAAQQYVKGNHVGRTLRERREGLPSPIIALTNRADRRCRKRYYSMIVQGKCTNKAKTAVARELAGFIWDAMMYYYQNGMHSAA